MKVPLADLTREYKELKNEIDSSISKVIERCDFILGEDVHKFEEEFAKFNGTKHAIAVASGTDALRIGIMASGIKQGNEVITTPFTFIATSETISQSGARIVFADINETDYNIDPKDIEKRITRNTKAILPVHLYGHPAKMDEIMDIAKRHNLIVIEDCAQAFTAKYNIEDQWKFVGSMGKCGAFSFFPAKNLGAYGDGGMITTNDDSVAKLANTLRNHGSSERYLYEREGFNSRLDTIQAAVLRVKLRNILRFTEMRNKAASKYNELLKDVVKTPGTGKNCYHSFNYYTIRFESKEIRDRVQKHLNENGIANQIYYPVSLHLQQAYKHLGYKKGDLSVVERIQDEVLSLPMFPQLRDDEIEYVSEKVKEAIKVKC